MEPNLDHYLPIILQSELGLNSDSKPASTSNVRRRINARNLSESGFSSEREHVRGEGEALYQNIQSISPTAVIERKGLMVGVTKYTYRKNFLIL